MSYSLSQDTRRRRGVGTGFSVTGRRTFLGYWVPLAVTVGIAAIGIAAWIWSERSEEEGGDDGGSEFPPPPPGDPSTEYTRTTTTETREEAHQDDGSVIARMQGALRRTPSPQQIFDGASRRVAAGMAAAGAMVGGALSSIREEGRGDFEDHSRWSEEVDSRSRNTTQTTTANTTNEATATQGTTSIQPSFVPQRKLVAIVVSSEISGEEPEDTSSEPASVLSHLMGSVDSGGVKVFVLIYAPDLKRPLGLQPSSQPTPSIASSFSNIGPEDVTGSPELPGVEMGTVEPRPVDDFETATPLFKTLYSQAQAIVEKETMIMPFSTPTGHVHILRQLSPELVYIQESLAGGEGESIRQISGWVRQVVIVVGDEGGRGGLIDSDDESSVATREKWWQKNDVTGIGKRIDVVDVLRTGDDWRRRVLRHE